MPAPVSPARSLRFLFLDGEGFRTGSSWRTSPRVRATTECTSLGWRKGLLERPGVLVILRLMICALSLSLVTSLEIPSHYNLANSVTNLAEACWPVSYISDPPYRAFNRSLAFFLTRRRCVYTLLTQACTSFSKPVITWLAIPSYIALVRV